LDRFVEIANGCGMIALERFSGQTAVVVSLRVRRIEVNSFIKVSNGLIVVALSSPSYSAAAIDFRRIRSKFDSLVEVRNCTIVITFAVVCITTINVALSILGSEFDRLVKVSESSIERSRPAITPASRCACSSASEPRPCRSILAG
jgi:hypothetical protein